MPQVQPGQAIVPGQAGAPELYGTQKVENTLPFQARLMELFKPQEFVTIKNINDDPVYWQYMPIDNEVEAASEDGIQRMITREAPEMWVILPNETEVVVGASAYRALDVMYKNFTAAKTLNKFRDPMSPQFNEKNEHLPKNFNFADGGAQEIFIKAAYLGKATPVFTTQEAAFVAAPEQPTAAAPTTPVQPATAQPQSPTPDPVDPTIPVPKRTDGAPLKPVTYADPDNGESKSLVGQALPPAKELTGAKK
jgi:hypothetical protein